MESVPSYIYPESWNIVMVDVFVIERIIVILPLNVNECISAILGISKVDIEPFGKPVLVSNILDKVGVSGSVHVGISIGWEMKYVSNLRSSNPHAQGSIS